MYEYNNMFQNYDRERIRYANRYVHYMTLPPGFGRVIVCRLGGDSDTTGVEHRYALGVLQSRCALVISVPFGV